MRYLYTAAFFLALPFIFLRAAWRSRRDPHNFKKIGERLGFYQSFEEPQSIWVHAVSYGEAVAAEPLITKLRATFPDFPIIVTTMTLTGAIRIQAVSRHDSNIRHCFVPYDFPFAIKRFLGTFKPKLCIIMETELWPNLLFLAGRHEVPIFLANARLSPNSFKGYQRIRKFISPLLQNITFVAAQSALDANRFKDLGLPIERVADLGNLKFDVKAPQGQLEKGLSLKQNLPFDLIWVAGSTHAKEEEQILDVFIRLKQQVDKALLILIPRHPERFDEVAALCLKKGQSIRRRSDKQLPDENCSVWLGDSMGEMYFYYALADVVFVGGSLVPVGGHNILEPATLKRPIITGPHLFNFVSISNLLQKANALHIISNSDELYTTLLKLASEELYRKEMGENGFNALSSHQGATDRYLAALSPLMTNECSA
jgi:3-deoxy-D-manno-octulosonic-acid transferase